MPRRSFTKAVASASRSIFVAQSWVSGHAAASPFEALQWNFPNLSQSMREWSQRLAIVVSNRGYFGHVPKILNPIKRRLAMILYPMIELLDGRSVSLFRGRTEEPQIWHVDPVEKAKSFAKAGAEWIHITDFDAMSENDRNADLIREIVLTAGIQVQLGGGFRSLERIADWIDQGVGRIVVGTMALLQPDLVKEAAKLFPDQIVLAVDVFEGLVVSDGWRQKSAFTPSAFLKAFENDPFAAIIVTDIDAAIGDAEDSIALITQLASEARTPVIARGLTRSLDDLSRLEYVPHVSGALIGRALFDRSIDIEAALKVIKPEVGIPAKFI
jgi:phosphoribosylformimino-5-aminoimidazole carboxamide ribotide isomerase